MCTCAAGCAFNRQWGETLAYNLKCKICLSHRGNWGMSPWRFGACCFGMTRAWWTSSQILFSKNSSNHSEDVVSLQELPGKVYRTQELWMQLRQGWKMQSGNSGRRQQQGASGQLIIALIREQCNPNNTKTNCFKSALAGKWVHPLHDPSLPHELQIQKYRYYYSIIIIISIIYLFSLKM